jgi:hypothetical protein
MNKRKTPKKRYPEEDTYTAMCLWEEYLSDPGAYPELLEEQEQSGTVALRGSVIALAKQCNDDYESLPKNHPMRDVEFDWEYVPHWLNKNSQPTNSTN